MSLNSFEPTNALGADALFVLPQGASTTYAPTNTPPRQVSVEKLALSRLPGAMRNMGWGTAAALMQRWFDSPAWEMPGSWKQPKTQPSPMSIAGAHCDQRILSMNWAMGFERCRKAVEAAKSVLTTPNAVILLRERLAEAGWKGGAPFKLGFKGMAAIEMDTISQVNFAELGGSWDVLDDMYGALGRALVKVGVVGVAVRDDSLVSGRTRFWFQVTHLGFYIRDQYDFNGLQYLGTWTEDRVLTKVETAFSMTSQGQMILRLKNGPFGAVTNSDFRNYRDEKGRGGDFVAYSDVLWRKSDQIIDLGTF